MGGEILFYFFRWFYHLATDQEDAREELQKDLREFKIRYRILTRSSRIKRNKKKLKKESLNEFYQLPNTREAR